MIYVDTRDFNKKVVDVKQEARTNEMISPAWIWMSCGAFIGLIASCIKTQKDNMRPRIGRYRNAKKGKE